MIYQVKYQDGPNSVHYVHCEGFEEGKTFIQLTSRSEGTLWIPVSRIYSIVPAP